MAQLTFTKKTSNGASYWEATATVNADFNLHLERNKPGIVQLEISTVENGAYALKVSNSFPEVFDQDFDALVYPKYIKVTTWAEPISGVVTEGD